ncbi:restriction endonuclease subunit S [Thomasclavelia cocleata]|uniref:restriction endonuclease subunit S n=1 Tax=Thomasclavelia cocleata TaxID=69824 RepID=UPI0025774901|nr:restriction endonuclease subunit S [Thomasclavelia cocleata]
MGKLEQLIKELCPDGVRYEKLEHCCNILDRQRRPVTKSARESGDYPYYGANGIQDYVSDYIFDGTFILVGEDGSVMNKNGNPIVTWAQGKIWVNNHAHIIEEIDRVLLRYLYHYIQTVDVTSLIHGNIPKLTGRDFKAIPIPLPPLPVQHEIVRILDNFTELTAELITELTAELTARKKQYEYYRDSLFTFGDDVERKPLGEIATIIRGGNFQKKDFTERGIPCIHYGQIYTKYGLSATRTITFINENVAKKSKFANTNDIIMAVTSENLEDVCKCVVWLGKEKVAISGHTAIIKHNQNAKFLAYYFHTAMFFKDKKKLAHGTKVIEVTPSKLGDIIVPLPSLSEQQRIVDILDRFDTLYNDISKRLLAEINDRQKRYEYYRNKLLSFKNIDVEV